MVLRPGGVWREAGPEFPLVVEGVGAEWAVGCP